MLPVTGALVRSAYADSTLLVVAAGQTRRNQLQRTAERFTQAKAPVMGIVLNEVSKENGYGYGYGYGSYQPDPSLAATPAQSNGHTDTPPSTTGRRSHHAR